MQKPRASLEAFVCYNHHMQKYTPWRIIKAAFHPVRWWFVIIALFGILAGVATVFEPVVYGRIVDVIVDALGSGNLDTLMQDITLLLLYWVGLFIATTVFSTLMLYIGWRASSRASVNFATNTTHELLRWSRQRYSRNSSGRILKLFNDAWEGIHTVNDAFSLHTVPTIITFFMVLGIGIWLNWQLTIVSLLLLPVSVAIGVIAWKHIKPRQREINDEWGEVSKHIGESVSNIDTVQNYTQEMQREKGVVRLLTKVARQQVAMNMFWSAFFGVGGGVSLVARILVFVAGVYLVSSGSVTLGVLITFLGLLNYILMPIQNLIAHALPQITKAFTSFKLLAEMMNDTNYVEESEGATKLAKVSGELVLDGVSFTYADGNYPTIKNIDLTIPDGTSCALVGPSGAGKSTLVKLINRTIDPTKGSVTLDGNDIRDYTLQSLRSHIGVVTQDTLLFHDTVANNVKFVKPRASRKEVEAACRKAEAHGFISKLPKGYDTIVGERGVKLSGGERQRIALARIFLADPPILVLDESTSALDSETEHKLQQTLKKVMQGRTTILIAHRLSTIYLADQIVVMKGGRIVDTGTHKELVNKGGLYDKLWSLQSGGYIQ